MAVLVVSLRNRGMTIGEIAGRLLNPAYVYSSSSSFSLLSGLYWQSLDGLSRTFSSSFLKPFCLFSSNPHRHPDWYSGAQRGRSLRDQPSLL